MTSQDTKDSFSPNPRPAEPPIDLESSGESVELLANERDDGGCASECEIVSVSSDIDEQEMKWRNITRINALISAGYNNPRLLLTRIFHVSPNILPSDTDSMWNILFSILSEPRDRKRLKQYSSMQSVIKLLRDSSRILVLTGAGISVSCGIPDFRSRSGVYARLARDFPDLRSPQDMFDLQYFLSNPKPFFTFAKELFPGQFKPSYAHRFIKLLEEKSKLLRNYTQNIDTLEQMAGITRIIQCHGSFATASCVSCKHKVRGEEIREAIMAQRIPHCPYCRPDLGLKGVPAVTDSGIDTSTKPSSSPPLPSHGVMKPDIVFFGEGLPTEFHESLHKDLREVDLILVMGSSLKVRPVSHIPDSVAPNIPQILINRESLSNHNFDAELLGDCDLILEHLCRQLGWNAEGDFDCLSSTSHGASVLTDVDLNVPLAAAVSALSSEIDIQTSGSGGTVDGNSASTKCLEVVSSSSPSSQVPSDSGKCITLRPTEPETQPNSAFTTEDAPCLVDSKSSTADDINSEVDIAGDNKPTLDGTSERPIDVDESNSAGESDSSSSSSISDNVAFNLSSYLPENSFTSIPPNIYIFKGAEFSLSLETASECLKNRIKHGDTSPFTETESDSSLSSNESNPSSDEDKFMQQLLRRCELDSELQKHRADTMNAAMTTIEVIDCDSLPSEQPLEKTPPIPSATEKGLGHDTEESQKTSLSTNGNPPESKRRRCSD